MTAHRPALTRRVTRNERRVQFEQEQERARIKAIEEQAEAEDAVKEADEEPETSAAPEERTDDPPTAAEQPPPPEPPPAAEAAAAAPVDEAPELETPTEPSPPQEYWEEKARWRRRGPDDYDWDDGEPASLPECLHDYDPLEDTDDYDPLADA